MTGSGGSVAGPLRPPIYQQIARVLRTRIFHGLYPPDALIPSENELGREFGVSRLTARKAIQELRHEGILVSRRGSGTYVARDPQIVQPVRFTGYLEDLVLQSLRLTTQVDAIRTVRASAEVRAVYQLPEGARVVRLARTRLAQGVPVHHIVNYLLPDIARSLSLRELSAGRPLTELLATELGLETTSATQQITAVGADDAVSSALKVSKGEPLLFVQTIGYAKDEPVNMILAYYRPDHVFFTATLTTL
jgi:GntR family transcriptional regulator